MMMVEENPNQKGLLRVLVDAWKAGEPRGDLIWKFINWSPIIFCPFGQAWYFNSENKYGVETWWAPHNLERELFHFVGGFLIGNAFGWIHPWIPVAMVFGVFGFLEFFIDRTEGKQFMKSVLDTVFWTGGSAIPAAYLKGIL